MNVLDEKSAPPRVLVCDDSPTNAAIAKAILEREGFRAEVAYSGEEVITLTRRSAYDLLLMDVIMEGLDGISITRQLRSQQSDKVFFPIVLLTAMTDMESKLAGLAAGATDFITKPFDAAELVARIRNHVVAKRMHDRLMTANRALEEERLKVVRVQLGLLPRTMPQVPGLAFAAGYQPSDMAGGDFYDVFVRENGNVLLAIGDVSGHGIPSAMYMSIVRAALHAKESEGASVDAILASLNHVLSFGLDEYSFVTFYIAEYNPRTRELAQASAGHHGPMLQDMATTVPAKLVIQTTLPLGVERTIHPPVTREKLAPGQRLILYTDGLFEQPSPEGADFGEEGMIASLMASSGDSPADAVASLLSEVRGFSGTQKLRDDVTLVMMDVVE